MINSMSSLDVDAADITDNDNVASVLETSVAISILGINSGTGATKSKPCTAVDYMTLAK